MGCLSLAGVPDSVGNSTVFHVPDNALGKSSRHGYGVDALREAADALPFAHPAVLGTHDGDHSADKRKNNY